MDFGARVPWVPRVERKTSLLKTILPLFLCRWKHHDLRDLRPLLRPLPGPPLLCPWLLSLALGGFRLFALVGLMLWGFCVWFLMGVGFLAMAFLGRLTESRADIY